MTHTGVPAPARLGPYELVRRIATGGMAEVYLARRGGAHGFRKLVALKRILPQFSSDPDFVAMFVDEARVCARLSHPNIVSVFDFAEEHGELYMAMEYVEGTTGARLIRGAAMRNEDVPLEVSLHLTLSILRGLDYAHNVRHEDGAPLCIVHRDVSPGNVLIDSAGTVKLTDFGIARAALLERRTDAGQLKGKIGYMSPEQVIGRELDARSDLFTAGIFLAELLILRPLFTGGRELDVLLRIRDADISAIDRASHRVPDDLRPVLFRALSKDPQNRFASAKDFAHELEEIIRRRRLQVNPSRLASYLEKIGLLERHGATDAEVLSPSDPEPIEQTTEPSIEPGSDKPSRDHSGAVAPAIYRTRGADGNEQGPITYPALLELFLTGSASRDTYVARESGQFRKADEIQELARFLMRPALRWDSTRPAENRREAVDRARLPTRVFHLAVRRETGALELASQTKRKKIFFVEGIPEFVASTDRNELFGEYLIGRGQVLRMEVEMALAMLPRFGGKLGDALVGLGVLRPIELVRAIHDQTVMRFLELFSWRRGDVSFVRGARSNEETFPLSVNPFELIARGLREHYEHDELAKLLGGLDDAPIEPIVTPVVRPSEFKLSDSEYRVLDSITAPIPLLRLVADMGGQHHIAPTETLRVVFLGLCCELVKCNRWVVPPSLVPRSAGAPAP